MVHLIPHLPVMVERLPAIHKLNFQSEHELGFHDLVRIPLSRLRTITPEPSPILTHGQKEIARPPTVTHHCNDTGPSLK